MGAQKNRLDETVLLGTHNICFGWDIKKIVFQYALLFGRPVDIKRVKVWHGKNIQYKSSVIFLWFSDHFITFFLCGGGGFSGYFNDCFGTQCVSYWLFWCSLSILLTHMGLIEYFSNCFGVQWVFTDCLGFSEYFTDCLGFSEYFTDCFGISKYFTDCFGVQWVIFWMFGVQWVFYWLFWCVCVWWGGGGVVRGLQNVSVFFFFFFFFWGGGGGG